MGFDIGLRKVGGYVDCSITAGDAVVDVGFLNELEIIELREKLSDALEWLEDE